MQVMEAIEARRSIRRFEERDIPREAVEQILLAGNLAPSAKNQQPWRFVVVTKKERESMAAAMRAGIDAALEQSGENAFHPAIISGAQQTLAIMERAPVTVFVLNPYGIPMTEGVKAYGEHFSEGVNLQSVGAAIENMCLAATGLGIGSLWICDVFTAYDELCAWLGTKEQLVAALTLGYPAESPAARPRKELSSIVQWR